MVRQVAASVSTVVHTPKRGDRFWHAFWLDPTAHNRHLLHEVTRVSSGTVWYRPVYSDGEVGKSVRCEIASLPHYVKEWVASGPWTPEELAALGRVETERAPQ